MFLNLQFPYYHLLSKCRQLLCSSIVFNCRWETFCGLQLSSHHHVLCFTFIRYHQTYQLTEKSDVYSFGVVLLELITGRPPLVPGSGNTHIVQWITPHLSRGSIDDIVDESLRGEYDPTCVWKILDLAIRCTANKGSQRPTMFEVVMQLRSCLELVIASDKCENENVYSGDFNVDQESASDIGTNMPGPTVPTR